MFANHFQYKETKCFDVHFIFLLYHKNARKKLEKQFFEESQTNYSIKMF
jgi:hypothetical protein